MNFLPPRPPTLHIGIDPGRSGAIGWICGEYAGVFNIKPKGRGICIDSAEADLYELCAAFEGHKLQVAIEWPVAPRIWSGGQSGMTAEAFGKLSLQVGQLDAVVQRLKPSRTEHVYPHVWKGRLGLAGKIDDAKSTQGARLWRTLYPQHSGLITGPRGGTLDGPLDSLLIAHWLLITGGPLGKWGGKRQMRGIMGTEPKGFKYQQRK